MLPVPAGLSRGLILRPARTLEPLGLRFDRLQASYASSLVGLLRASYAADELKTLLAYCPLDGQRRPAAGLMHLMRRHVVA